MEFARILQTLLPNASRATIEIDGARITIEPSKETPAPAPHEEVEITAKTPRAQDEVNHLANSISEVKAAVESLAMEDILTAPPAPKKEVKLRVHREARQLHKDREHVFEMVRGSGRSGMTSRDLVAAGVSPGTVYSDLRWLVMQGRIIRSGDSYFVA